MPCQRYGGYLYTEKGELVLIAAAAEQSADYPNRTRTGKLRKARRR